MSEIPEDRQKTGEAAAQAAEAPAPATSEDRELQEHGGEGEPGVGGASAAPEKLLRTKEVVSELFGKLGAEVDVEVRDSAEAVACSVTVRKGAEVLSVGPRGTVLEAVQYLVNRIVNRDAEGRKWVSVEIGPFRELPAADPAMAEMAQRLGEAAKRIGKTLTVVPMQSRDRRAVHVALAEVEGVKTRSEGEGILRRLLVEVKQ